MLNGGKEVAIKTESLSQTHFCLPKEIKNYSLLEAKFFPRLIQQGIEPESERMYLVTDLLGPSLENLWNFCDGKFSLKTTLMLFYQILDRLQFMHSVNIIHRDLKPDNIMIGLGNDSVNVFFVDFGLSRSVIDPET